MQQLLERVLLNIYFSQVCQYFPYYRSYEIATTYYSFILFSTNYVGLHILHLLFENWFFVFLYVLSVFLVLNQMLAIKTLTYMCYHYLKRC